MIKLIPVPLMRDFFIFVVVESFPNACATLCVYDIINQKEFGRG